ncbi:MAG: hypothetical protein FJZ98_03720 [Chloroflexi bacterium]|nr:hypothetical protein [Chloroflexota bacterium]
MDLIEKLWDDILSRDPLKIRAAFEHLNDQERRDVFTHLEKMSRDNGWHPEQKISADAALDVIIHIIDPK